MKQSHHYELMWIFLLVANCAPRPSEYTNIDSEIIPYFYAFKIEAEARGIGLDLSHLKIHLDKNLIGTNKAGSCTISDSKTGDLLRSVHTTHLNISINPDRFLMFDDYRKIELLFHELGHCLLGLPHNDKTILTMTPRGLRNLPASWMSTYQGGYNLNDNEKDLLLGYYIHQLFDPQAENADLTNITTIRSFGTRFLMTFR